MDQCSQLSIEFDRLGLTDLLEGISVAGDRFYLVEHLFASGKVNQEYRNGAPGPREGPRGRSARCGNGLFAQCVRLRSEINPCIVEFGGFVISISKDPAAAI